MGQHRTRERLVDRAVEGVVKGLFPAFAKILAHTIEDDDGVVQRITEHGQQARDDGE